MLQIKLGVMSQMVGLFKKEWVKQLLWAEVEQRWAAPWAERQKAEPLIRAFGEPVQIRLRAREPWASMTREWRPEQQVSAPPQA